MLFAFQCVPWIGGCSGYDRHNGANACFVLRPDELTSGLTQPPMPDFPSQTEARVLRWFKRDDGIPNELRPKFLHGADFFALPEETRLKVHPGTKLGSVPDWIQEPEEPESS